MTPALLAVEDITNWSPYFNGANYGMGPYTWIDGPSYGKWYPALDNVVNGGQVGGTKLYICRSKGPDGTHPGKYFDGVCNIGWGGKEYSMTAGYELLVNNMPKMDPQAAPYFTQVWVPKDTHEGNQFGFFGGMVGTQPMRPCRAFYTNGTHLGKEWAGACHIGFGGKEVTVAPYEVLNLKFDKQAWQNAGSPGRLYSFTVTTADLLAGRYNLNLAPMNQTLQATVTYLPPSNYEIVDYAAQWMAQMAAVDAAVYTANKITWYSGGLGTGLSALATRIPNLFYSMIDDYNAKQTDASLRRDRTTLYNNVVAGDVNAQAFMIFLIADRAKTILNSQTAWTDDETSLVNFLVTLGNVQRVKAAGQAMTAFDDWKVADRAKLSVGLAAMIYTPGKPPGEFLAQARSGYAISQENIVNFARLITTAAGLTAAAGGALAAGLTGAGSAAMFAVSSSLAVGAKIGSLIGTTVTAAGATAAFAGTVAIVAALITAGIVKGVELAAYDQYVKDMDAAVAAAKVPMTVADLKNTMNTSEGFTKVVMWLTAQAATGTRP